MKKILVMILAVALLCTALVSCNGGGGGGTSYSDLAIVELGLPNEYFGIAFRAGSDMTRKVEDITVDLIKDGLLEELSETYEVAGIMGKADYTPAADPCEGSGDWDYIKNKGTLVIGITDYKPMDYKNAQGEWVGFDADYARAVCEALDVTPVFKEIEWDFKLESLAAKEIDCIWNGMTIDPAIEVAADCTVPYMYNTQVAVVKKVNADKYKDLASLAGATIAAESGSAGEKVALAEPSLKDGVKGVTAQTDALLEVMAGASDAAIVDLTLAKALIK